LENTVFQADQLAVSTVHLLLNVTLPCSGSADGGKEDILSAEEKEERELCVVEKECGVAFDEKTGTPVKCEDQVAGDTRRNLTFQLHFRSFFP
jgi:hypothetical protein